MSDVQLTVIDQPAAQFVLAGPGFQGAPGSQGPAGSTGSRFLDEMTAIYLNGSFSIGTPGRIPFGVGPVATGGASVHYIGASSYNPIHIASGSFY